MTADRPKTAIDTPAIDTPAISGAARSPLRTARALLLAAALGLGVAACRTPDAPSAPPSGAAATEGAKPAASPVAAVAPHPGEGIYRQYCAACHDNPEATKSPALSTLQAMSAPNLEFALTQGKMQAQAAAINPADLQLLINYLVADRAAGTDWINAMMCPADRREVKLDAAASIAGFGFDAKNQRRLSPAAAGLRTADFANLELAWSMAFPAATTMRAQPAVVGGTMFYPVADASALFAINIEAARPCLQWVYRSPTPLRTSASYGVLPDGRKVVMFAGFDTTLHVVDARTGEAVWTKQMRTGPYSLTTGTPVLAGDRIIVPISAFEITVGALDTHECCKSAGSVAALDALTGKEIWHTRTMPEATPQRDRGDGKMLWGPSGAPIWTSPAIDEKRGLVYLGTGEATSAPAHRNTNSVMAFDLKTGAVRWSMQATPNDIFLIGCGPRPTRPNCEKDTVYRDVDFGASMILVENVGGRDLLLAGQKSGTVWALNPDDGKLVWRRDLGTGGGLGGVHWGIAADARHVYAPISYVGRPLPDQPIPEDIKPGMYALDLATGAIAWRFNPEVDCAGDRRERMPICGRGAAFSAAPAVIDGAVVQGALDGWLRAFDAATGKELFRFDTARTFEDAVNGVPGKGGSIDSASVWAAGGMLFVSSGYGMFGQTPGNVLLAFRPKAN